MELQKFKYIVLNGPLSSPEIYNQNINEIEYWTACATGMKIWSPLYSTYAILFSFSNIFSLIKNVSNILTALVKSFLCIKVKYQKIQTENTQAIVSNWTLIFRLGFYCFHLISARVRKIMFVQLKNFCILSSQMLSTSNDLT